MLRSLPLIAFFLLAPLPALSTANQPAATDLNGEIVQNAQVSPQPSQDEILQLASRINLPDAELMEINDEIKKLLDDHVRPVKDKARRTQKLHEFLFTQAGRDIQYDPDYTRTAQETFDTRSGNCISHAALYIASARYLGMNARFQRVEVPRSWEKEEDFFIIPGHVNAVVNLPFGKRAVAEFVSTYYSSETGFKEEVISDKRALADFYNNLGMEAMRDRDYAKAIAYLHKSIDVVGRNDSVWSNLGVVYKFVGAYDLAEKAYLKALDIHGRNISTIKNLYILYYETGRENEAQQFAKRVERDNRKNPFFLARMAETDISLGNYRGALSNIRRAIRINPEEETFYVTLSKIHAATGNIEASIEALNKAAEFSKSAANDYPRKVEMLQALK